VIAFGAVALAYGLAVSLLFRSLVNHGAMRLTVNRILAHVIAFRLFVDEPRLVLRSQAELLLENARLLRLLIGPVVAGGIIFALLYGSMDRHFGHRSVRAGASAVVTLPGGSDLRPSVAFRIDTPPVRVPRLHQVSWRVLVLRESPLVAERAAVFGLPWQAPFLILSTFVATVVAGAQSVMLRARNPNKTGVSDPGKTARVNSL